MESGDTLKKTNYRVYQGRIKSQVHPFNRTSNRHPNLRGTLATSMTTRIDRHRVRKRPNSPSTIQTKNTYPKRTKRLTPQVSPRTTEGWRSPNLTLSSTSINPDLDTHLTHRYELMQHPTPHTHTTLHIPDGTAICSI